MNPPLNQDRQDGQDGGAENSRPNVPHNPRPSTSLPQPLQDGGQPGEQQLAERDRQPGSLPASFLSPPSLYSASNSVLVSDPTHVASLHPDFQQPSLASHLTKATSTAITNGEYVDFAFLLPLSYSLQYIKVDHAISILQELGQGCFMSKLDIKSAFRNIAVHPSDWELLGMKWEGLYFFDVTLPFGLRSAPFLFDELSSALEWIIQNKRNISKVIHILDDFFFATPPPRAQCMTALCHILHLFTDLNIPIAPGKTFPASTSLEFMGVLLDSNAMEARLPLDKLTHLQAALHQWKRRKSATLQELQSLIGSLQLACKVVALGRPFLQRIIFLTKGVKFPHWHIRLNSGFCKDIKMWQDFLQNWNGVSLFLDSEATSPPALQLYTDASGSPGYGGLLAGQLFQGHWLLHHTLSKKRGISIEWQELFPIYLACILWGPCWSGKRIRMWCYNKSVVSIINSKHSKSPRVMDLVRAITPQTLKYNFTFTATHIPGLDNSIADSLSRCQMDRFRTLAPTASPSACTIPPSAMNI